MRRSARKSAGRAEHPEGKSAKVCYFQKYFIKNEIMEKEVVENHARRRLFRKA